MILPDDVILIISEYSKPLKRRHLSQFWIDNPVPSNERVDHAIYLFNYYTFGICSNYRLEKLETQDKWIINIWNTWKESLHSKLTFTLSDLMKWDGVSFECYDYFRPYWSLPQDVVFTHLVTENDKVIRFLKKDQCRRFFVKNVRAPYFD